MKVVEYTMLLVETGANDGVINSFYYCFSLRKCVLTFTFSVDITFVTVDAKLIVFSLFQDPEASWLHHRYLAFEVRGFNSEVSCTLGVISDPANGCCDTF